MKKLIFIFTVILGLGITSCNNNAINNTNTEDSVKNDSVKVDSLVTIDTTVVNK